MSDFSSLLIFLFSEFVGFIRASFTSLSEAREKHTSSKTWLFEQPWLYSRKNTEQRNVEVFSISYLKVRDESSFFLFAYKWGDLEVVSQPLEAYWESFCYLNEFRDCLQSSKAVGGGGVNLSL